MSHEERQLLDEALIRTYNAKGITHDNASLEDPANPSCYREMPVLGDLYEILKAAPETTRMAHILNRLVNGSASTFNKQTNVRLDNKYTVLDISSLTGDLLTVGMFVVLDFVWDRAKADRTEEKAYTYIYSTSAGSFFPAPAPRAPGWPAISYWKFSKPSAAMAVQRSAPART